jgi:hypothetical protein
MTIPPKSRNALVTLIAALLQTERRIAMLERRLGDARWLGPNEIPNDNDKRVALARVSESIGPLITLAEDELEDQIDDDDVM